MRFASLAVPACIAATACSAPPQPTPAAFPASLNSPRLAALSLALQAGDSKALDEFFAELEGASPIVEPFPGQPHLSLVTYVWRASEPDVRRVHLMGGLATGGPKPLHRLGHTQIWFLSEPVPRDARYRYSFMQNLPVDMPLDREEMMKTYQALEMLADPFNEHSAPGVGSVAELPDCPAQPWSETPEGHEPAALDEFEIESETLGQSRKVTLYVPTCVDPKSDECGLLVVFDASVYGANPEQSLVPTPVILENLLAAGRIEPMVAALIHNSSQDDRSEILTCSDSFADFLAAELVPHLSEKVNLSKDPSRHVVAGSSFGGLMATYSAMRHPEVFGNVLSQSGSYWFTRDWREQPQLPGGFSVKSGYIQRLCKSEPGKPLKFYLDVGRMEDNAAMLATNRHLRDILELKGCEVTFVEFNGGHDYLTWRESLADGLLALVGKDGGESSPQE